MTLKEALELGKAKLQAAGIEEFALDAWYLLEFVTRVTRAQYFGDSNKEISKEEEMHYLTLIEQRRMRIPLQHITGVQEFMGLLFKVDENVLIPRQDTEILVETVLEQLTVDMNEDVADDKNDYMEVLDMCTGSGCILISLLKYNKAIRGTAIDISAEALKIARENGVLNEVEAQFIESDLFGNVTGEYDVIVSNPPYIKTEEIETLEAEVKLHDPMLALDGKEDGLFFYRKIVDESIKYLKPGGLLAFEIGAEQGEDVSSYMEAHGFHSVEVKKDLAGLDRVVYGRLQ